MTSTRQSEANRRNARRSTGPRTAAGKARARMNAVRHGLACAAGTVEDDARAQALAHALAAGSTDDADLACAAASAECALDLDRARAAEACLIQRFFAIAVDPESSAEERRDARAARADLVIAIERLQRYGRCALARRRRALRERIQKGRGLSGATAGCDLAERTHDRTARAVRPSRAKARSGGTRSLRRAGLRGTITVSRLTWWRLWARAGPRLGPASRHYTLGRLEAFAEALARHIHAIAIARGAWRARTRVVWSPQTGFRIALGRAGA